ncbi:MAG TPA: hypothetical protein PKC28_16135, partial [Bdellovibrionales bacterium]|nr:hypothetical protein [Bdellovibrionales bacterium]
TKGQFSATAEAGSKLKNGYTNTTAGIDLCSLALELGATFVARSFSGDGKQLVPLLNMAIRHQGTAFIDVISPCITFANHEGSSRSFDAVKTNNVQLQELGFYQPQQEIKVDYSEGATQTVKLPDGAQITLRKLVAGDHDIQRRDLALQRLQESRAKGEFLTGLLYWDRNSKPLTDQMNLVDQPLRDLGEETRPSLEALEEMLGRFA